MKKASSASSLDSRNNPESQSDSNISSILDRTQEHLILQLDTWRHNKLFNEIGLPAMYCLIALSLLVIFAIESFMQGHVLHAQVLLGFGILTVLCFIYIRISNNKKILSKIMALLFGALCIFLFITGGIEGTGSLWSLIFPLTAFYIQSLIRGLISIILFLSLIIFTYSMDIPGIDPYSYSQVTMERLFAVFITLSAMSFLYVFSRTTTEVKIDTQSKDFLAMANTDELTGLSNRRHMTNLLVREFSRVNRTKRTFSLIIFDIDHFKNINDDYGHDAGDEILKDIPALLFSALRAQDVCARWGGEEFLILLPETGIDGAQLVAERLRKAFAVNTINFKSQNLSVTISLGVSEYNLNESLENFLTRTDDNLYKAKQAGRNCIAV